MPLSAHAAAISELYGLGDVEDVAATPVRGEQGEVWELRTVYGRFAVKELLMPQQETDADADVRVQERMLASGVPLPRPLRTVGGDVLAAVAGHTVRVYEWVDLHGLDRGIDAGAVGRLVAAIHAVKLPAAGPVDPWYQAPVGARTWDALIAELRAAHAPFADRLTALRDELVATERLIIEASSLQVCHRDLFADNVRRTANGSLSVIDWENCGAANPSHELAVVLLEYACGDGRRARQLHDAYVEAGGSGRVLSRSDFTMAVAQLGHILAFSARRWLDSTVEPQRERYAAAVAEFVDEPLTRDAIDRVLDAIG